MKYVGSAFEFVHERNADLMRCYRHQIAVMPFITLEQLGRNIVAMPSERFWVSAARAKVVIAAIEAGRPVLRSMRPTKREMFLEIHRRVLELRRECPSLSLLQAVREVVESPAPCFYMEPRSAIETIYKIKNKFYESKF